MSRFQKIQKWSSILPFWSTFFVAIVSMVMLKRHKASMKRWCALIAILSAAVIMVFLLNTVIMTGQHPILNVIVSGLLLSIANIFMVDLQIKCSEEATHMEEIPQVKNEATRPKKSSRAKVWMIIGSVAVVYVVAFILLSAWLTPSMDMEDANGPEDTSLAVLEMEEILTTTNHYSASFSSTSQTGAKTDVADKLKDYDYEECRFNCREINGIMTLQATQTTAERMMLDCSSTLEEGNAEIIVLVDGEYFASIPVNQVFTMDLSDISGKLIVVRIAAENAKLNIHVRRTIY